LRGKREDGKKGVFESGVKVKRGRREEEESSLSFRCSSPMIYRLTQ